MRSRRGKIFTSWVTMITLLPLGPAKRSRYSAYCVPGSERYR